MAIVLAGWLAWAQAAELGEPVVRSYAGQPLVADIELTALADPGQAVVVRLASADVYKVANIAMQPVLSSLNMSVMRRDGRQFLHITSTRPVNAEYLHLFLDLAEGGKRNVRAATLWLSPDPNPAPAPAPAVAPKLPLVAAPVPVPMPVPVKPAPLAEPAPLPKPARVLRLPAPPAVCPAPMSAEKVQACAETDYKNGLLSAQIVELEEKVKALQVAMEQGGMAAAAAPAVAKVTPPIAKITPPLTPAKAAAKPASGFPWLWVSGLLLLLVAVGGGGWFWLRRRKLRPVDTDASESIAWYSRIAGRLRPTPKTAAAEGGEPPAAA